MGSDETLWYSSFDGTNWAAQKQIPSTWSSVGPSIAAYKGKLYAFWKGMGTDHTIWYTSTADGNSWAAQMVLPQGILTRTGPLVAMFGAQMYVVWDTPAGQMHYTSTGDGEYYGFGDHVEEGLPDYMATSRIPSVAVYNGSLVFAWKGQGNDKRIWLTKTSF